LVDEFEDFLIHEAIPEFIFFFKNNYMEPRIAGSSLEGWQFKVSLANSSYYPISKITRAK
jgi:hypothetical protein